MSPLLPSLGRLPELFHGGRLSVGTFGNALDRGSRNTCALGEFILAPPGAACVSGGAPYDPKAEAKERRERHKLWRESLTPEMAWVVDTIAKVDKYARGHERTMAMHAFYSQRVDKHANMPKSTELARVCMERKDEFEQFINEHFKTP